MGFLYTFQQEGCDPVSANYDSLEEALAQASYDGATPGAPGPRHILDEDGVVAAAFEDVSVFQIISGGEVVEEKPEPAPGDEGVLVITQQALEGEGLAAYAEALANG
jgi:hypothetical protein